MDGWIKLHKRFDDWEWRKKPEFVSVFVFLLIKANYDEGKFEGFTINRGQLVTSIENIAKATGVSIQTVRTILGKFQKSGEILLKSTNKFSIITLCNYETYQGENLQTNKQLTNNQQTTNNNKEIKNIRTNNILYGNETEKSTINNLQLYNQKLETLKNLCGAKYETLEAAFAKWAQYLSQQHSCHLRENEFTLEVFIDAVKRVGVERFVFSVDYSIISNYRKIYDQETRKPAPAKTKTRTHLSPEQDKHWSDANKAELKASGVLIFEDKPENQTN
jgi:hypothetical protein